jgi:hypothetical protein
LNFTDLSNDVNSGSAGLRIASVSESNRKNRGAIEHPSWQAFLSTPEGFHATCSKIAKRKGHEIKRLAASISINSSPHCLDRFMSKFDLKIWPNWWLPFGHS